MKLTKSIGAGLAVIALGISAVAAHPHDANADDKQRREKCRTERQAGDGVRSDVTAGGGAVSGGTTAGGVSTSVTAGNGQVTTSTNGDVTSHSSSHDGSSAAAAASSSNGDVSAEAVGDECETYRDQGDGR